MHTGQRDAKAITVETIFVTPGCQVAQAESNGCTIAKQNTPPGRSTREVSAIAPEKSSMSSRDMDATARSIQLSVSGGPAASACATGSAGDPAAAARASEGDRSMPSTRRPAASN